MARRPRPLRTPVPLSELEQHLKDQIELLRASCAAFDAGSRAEFKRIAAAIRILVHDSGQARSLLGQLGMIGAPFVSYAVPLTPGNLLSETSLALMVMGEQNGYQPVLDQGLMPPRDMPFAQWWTEPVFKASNGDIMDRAAFVLVVANQDGGAHVDPEIDAQYRQMSKENAAGWILHTPEGEAPLEHLEKVYLRHIGFEMLQTLDRAWRKRIGNRPCECGCGRKARYCAGPAATPAA